MGTLVWLGCLDATYAQSGNCHSKFWPMPKNSYKWEHDPMFGASLLVACSPRKDELICVVKTTPFLHKNKFQGVSDFFLVSPHHSVTACVRIIPNTAHWNLKKMWQYHDNVVLCVCNRP